MSNALKGALLQQNGGAVQTLKPTTIKDFLEVNRHELAKALPSHVTPDRILRIAESAINRVPKLRVCTLSSLISGVVISSQLGLELNTPLGHAYLIPYTRNFKETDGSWKKVDEAQFQLGYKGLLDLAYRSGQFDMIYAENVYSNDEFSYRYGLNKTLEHTPTQGEPGEFIGCYAVFHLKSGGKDFKYWSKAKIIDHAKKYSKSWNVKEGAFQKGSQWDVSFEGMAKVPVVKDLLKLAPQSIEFANQLALDYTVKQEIKADMLEAKGIDPYEMLEGPGDITIETGANPETGEVPITEVEKAEAAPEASSPKTTGKFRNRGGNEKEATT